SSPRPGAARTACTASMTPSMSAKIMSSLEPYRRKNVLRLIPRTSASWSTLVASKPRSTSSRRAASGTATGWSMPVNLARGGPGHGAGSAAGRGGRGRAPEEQADQGGEHGDQARQQQRLAQRRGEG